MSATGSLRRPMVRALLTLTFTTGVVDAVSYLGLGHVFAANMTGNVVLLGFGIAGAGGLPVIAPAIALVAFLLGAGAGGALVGRRDDAGAHRLARAVAIEVAFVLLAVALCVAVPVDPGSVSGDAVVALLAFPMGMRNATVRTLGVPDLTTTVLTLTLTGLAADSTPAGGSGAGSARRIAAVLSMFAGAVAGALLVKTSLVAGLAAVALVGAVVLVLLRGAR